METVTVTFNRSALLNNFLVQKENFFIAAMDSLCVTSTDEWTSIICWTTVLIIAKRLSQLKIPDWSMSYFHDKDKINLFCNANLSKLTICKRFTKCCLQVRFAVTKCCLECFQGFWNFISNLNQLRMENK